MDERTCQLNEFKGQLEAERYKKDYLGVDVLITQEVADRTGKLLRRLGGARDVLGKLRSDSFTSWLQTSRRTLEDKENTLSDLNQLSNQSESVKEFHGDVIAHQADLRFITMSAHKFVDECKDYLSVLNDFRTTLPERLPHIEQISSSDSPIRQEVSLVTA